MAEFYLLPGMEKTSRAIFWNNAKFIGSSVEQVSSGLIEGKSDVIRFKMMDTGYYMVYQPIGFQDWLTLWIVPEYMVNASMNHVQSMTSIIFMGFFAIVCTMWMIFLLCFPPMILR